MNVANDLKYCNWSICQHFYTLHTYDPCRKKIISANVSSPTRTVSAWRARDVQRYLRQPDLVQDLSRTTTVHGKEQTPCSVLWIRLVGRLAQNKWDKPASSGSLQSDDWNWLSVHRHILIKKIIVRQGSDYARDSTCTYRGCWEAQFRGWVRESLHAEVSGPLWGRWVPPPNSPKWYSMKRVSVFSLKWTVSH